MVMCQFTEGYKDFPICNHVLDIGPENIGYQTGIFDDGLPFEVEEYEYGEDDCKIREMSIIMPDIGVEEDDCEEYEDSDSYDGNINVEGFKYSMDIKDCSVLPIGMVFRGQEDSFSIIKWYQEFIEEKRIVNYLSDVRSCSVFYYTDVNGNDMVQIRIGLITNGQKEAISNIRLRNYPMRTGIRPNLQVVR